MKKHLIYLTVFALALTGAFAAVSRQARQQRPHIGVLQWTEQVVPFRQTREGILAGLKAMGLKEGENLTLTLRNAEQSPEKALEAVREFTRANVDLIVTLGTRCTLIAMETAPETPVVYAVVADPKATGIVARFGDSGRNLTGITMGIPALTQLKAVQNVLPDLSRMGVLYCTRTLAAVTTGKEAATAARALGWEVKAVTMEEEAMGTLEERVAELATGVDAIYIPADSILNLPVNMRRINTVTDTMGVPVICVGEDFVKERLALMAVHCNFEDTGRQVSHPVDKILAGVAARSIPSQSPHLNEISISLAKARNLNIPIHRNAILMADNIYEQDR